MPSFRNRVPTRNCDKVYSTHHAYKKFLVRDFDNRCGYCDGSDVWHGGYKNFHIDHFAPKTKFPDLKCTYTNLIYACPSCNSAKSDTWPSSSADENIVDEKGFLNPVSDDLNEHFERDDLGNIIALTPIANDMAINLNLSLPRHGVLWMLCNLSKTIDEYEKTINSPEIDATLRKELEETHYSLHKVFKSYLDKLKVLNS